jgi:hypothetical protein
MPATIVIHDVHPEMDVLGDGVVDLNVSKCGMSFLDSCPSNSPRHITVSGHTPFRDAVRLIRARYHSDNATTKGVIRTVRDAGRTFRLALRKGGLHRIAGSGARIAAIANASTKHSRHHAHGQHFQFCHSPAPSTLAIGSAFDLAKHDI